MKVCIAVDNTEIAKRAFDYYYKTLHKPSNELVLCHVSKCSSFTKDVKLSKVTAEDVLQSLNDVETSAIKVKAKYEHLMRDYGDINVHTFKIRPSTDNPGESLVALAHREGCQLIIMGTRSLSKHERLKGSVSDYVVHHSWIPVLVCPLSKK